MDLEKELSRIKLRKENEKNIKYAKTIGSAVGIILTKPQSLKNKRRMITLLLSVITICAIYAHGRCVVVKRSDLMISTEALGVATQSTISLIKIIHVALMQSKYLEMLDIVLEEKIINKIEELIEDFVDIEYFRQQKRKVLKGSWKLVKIQLVGLLSAITCAVSFYYLRTIALNYYNIFFNEDGNYTVVHIFPSYYDSWETSGKINQFPYLQMALFAEAVSLYVCGIGGYLYNSLFIILIAHAVGMMRILKAMIELCTTHHVPKKGRLQYLLICCYFHRRIHEYCKNVNSLYSIVTLLQFCQSVLVLAVIIFQINASLGKDYTVFITMVLYGFASGFELLTHCFNGQRLTNEGECLALSWYCDCKWYQESEQFQKIIYMMIIRSRTDIVIVASYFAAMNLQTFQSITNSSGSYFLMLRNFT